MLGIVLNPLPGDERFRGWLAIPYLTRRGGTKAIRFRNLTGNDDAKVGQHKGQPIRIYNSEALFRTKRLELRKVKWTLLPLRSF